MKLIDKPHCTKHEVYTQGCIGCRIKNRYDTADLTPDTIPSPIPIPAKYLQPRKGHDLVATDSDEYDKPRKSANITELKKLLKAIRNSGAEDTQRSLQADVEAITELFT